MERQIGFIGLGMMGGPMSKRLYEAGYKVVGYDISPAACEMAGKNGIEIASSPKTVAEQCNVIISMLTNSEIVEKVVLGPNGIMGSASDEATLLDMTSAYPMSTLKIGKELKKKNINMLDAPVSGGVVGAERGTLSIIVGGDPTVFDQCRPILEILGKNIFYMGPLGSGHTMKAINNFLSACSVVATAEAVTLAAKAGLEPQKVVDVLQVSTGRNYATEWKFPKFVLPRTFDDGFRLELLSKDLDIMTRLARELHVPTFTAHTVQQIYNFALGHGFAEKGHTSVVQLMEEWAGIEIQ